MSEVLALRRMLASLQKDKKGLEEALSETSSALYKAGMLIDCIKENRDLSPENFRDSVLLILDNLDFGRRGNEHVSVERPTRGS